MYHLYDRLESDAYVVIEAVSNISFWLGLLVGFALCYLVLVVIAWVRGYRDSTR